VKAALEASGMAGERNGKGGARFFATDAPERFARVGAIFLGRGIDAADVTLVDLRP
jgi:glutamate racemase